jgi:hypothetical protein
MSDDFTDTELAIISLVLSQNAEEYGDPAELEGPVREVRRISAKAREQMGTNE